MSALFARDVFRNDSTALSLRAVGGERESCACFSLCNVEDTAIFRSRIPRWVNSSESPWYVYLCAVYGPPHESGAPPLPFDLASLHFFYHVWPIASCDDRGRTTPRATCAESVCDPWMAPRGTKLRKPQ